jgi:hypothetical protein
MLQWMSFHKNIETIFLHIFKAVADIFHELILTADIDIFSTTDSIKQ